MVIMPASDLFCFAPFFVIGYLLGWLSDAIRELILSGLKRYDWK